MSDHDYDLTEKELQAQREAGQDPQSEPEAAENGAPPKEPFLQGIMPVIVLTLICAVAGAALAAVKVGTAERIESQLLTNVQGPALSRMFPHAENNPLAERRKFSVENGREIAVFPIYERGHLRAVALEGIGQGYGGDLGVMVGFNLENDTLNNIAITISKETPGIGSEVGSARFTKQFRGPAESLKLRGQDGSVDALSGATISSTGAVNAVQEAHLLYQQLKPKLLKAWPEKK